MKTKLDYLLSIVIFCALVSSACAVVSYRVWWVTAAAFQPPKPDIITVPVESDIYIPDDNLPNDCATVYNELPADEQLTIACFYDVKARSIIGPPDLLVALFQEEKALVAINDINSADKPTWTLLVKAPPNEALAMQFYENVASYSSVRTEVAQLRFTRLSPFIDCHGGDVVIYELTYDTNGRITQLALDFEQECSTSDVTHIRGYIRYQATTPIVR